MIRYASRVHVSWIIFRISRPFSKWNYKRLNVRKYTVDSRSRLPSDAVMRGCRLHYLEHLHQDLGELACRMTVKDSRVRGVNIVPPSAVLVEKSLLNYSRKIEVPHYKQRPLEWIKINQLKIGLNAID